MQIPTSKTPSPPPLPQQCHFESAPQVPNTTLPDYPKIGVLLALVDAEKPELQIHELETSLPDAGVVLSSQVMLLPEDVLSVIGNMGQKQARILCNCTKWMFCRSLDSKENWSMEGKYDKYESDDETEGGGEFLT
ncbi:hypothetical protein BDR07DRAFT_1374224 [Suillus spraguei]|nr:hypothetical protein BDR07DRAFT_1374224 [Suillus spraguei]